MKRVGGALVSLAFMAAFAGPAGAQPKANPGFEKLKSLVGEWQAKTPDGKSVTAAYQLASSGTVLMENLSTPGEMNMVTMIHPDGDRLVLTHYCAANNQPRMRAAAVPGEIKRLNFSFLDATNLPSAEVGHMHAVSIAFEDANHFTEEWTWKEKGTERNEVFRFARKM